MATNPNALLATAASNPFVQSALGALPTAASPVNAVLPNGYALPNGTQLPGLFSGLPEGALSRLGQVFANLQARNPDLYARIMQNPMISQLAGMAGGAPMGAMPAPAPAPMPAPMPPVAGAPPMPAPMAPVPTLADHIRTLASLPTMGGGPYATPPHIQQQQGYPTAPVGGMAHMPTAGFGQFPTSGAGYGQPAMPMMPNGSTVARQRTPGFGL
jgi:hypothetical protein